MQTLEIIKNYLNEHKLTNNAEILPNGKRVLVVDYESEFSTYKICIDEPIENEKYIRLYSILSRACKEAKYNTCRIINDYNKQYDYAKFYYQESEQGELILASYIIPSMETGLTYFFGKALDKLVFALDNAKFLMPTAVFNGQIKWWDFSDSD